VGAICKENNLKGVYMTLARTSKQYLGVRAAQPPNVQLALINPTTQNDFVKGDIWLNTVLATSFMWSGAVWIAMGSGATGGVVTLTGDSGGPISPVAGNIDILGTTDEIEIAGTAGTLTASLSATLVLPGTLTVAGTTLINASGAAATTIGTGGTGVVNIGNATGNTDVTGALAATTTLSAGTGITSTLGDITATDGDLVLGTAGNKLIITKGANASNGLSAAMAGSPGAVTVATTACSATANVFYVRATTGGTPGHVSITAQDGTGFTLTSTGNETSTFNWWIINA